MGSTNDYLNYHLPQDLIAQSPANPRDHSRLLTVDRQSGDIQDKYFYDIVDLLPDSCSLVFNDTKVIHARLFGRRPSGGKIECFLIRPLNHQRWEALLKPAKRLKNRDIVHISDDLSIQIIEKGNDKVHIVELICETDVFDCIEAHGKIPLPPYIQNESVSDNDYQTVFAKSPGAVAAPTAGLHFSESILEKLKKKNIKTHHITLHVGLGTFEPIQEKDLDQHVIHEESYYISNEVAEDLLKDQQQKRPIIAVGTTVTRTLESAFQNGTFKTGWQQSQLFIKPGYSFKVINGLITNFHLPQSTLLCLVSAFSSIEHIQKAYSHAISKRYRFYSFGDAMLLY